MKKVLKNLAFVAATVLMLSACSEKKTNEVNNFRIQRGTNVSHWLSQSEERGEARLLHIQEDDFARCVCRLTRYSSGTSRVTSFLKHGI